MSSVAQDKRNALNRAVYFLRAKARSRGLAYSCFLDEQPTELVPGAARQALMASADDGDLAVNTTFRYQQGSEPPAEIRALGLPLDGLVRGYPIAWVEEPAGGIWMPYWARGEWAVALESLRAGLPPPSTLGANLRRTLTLANVLVPRGYEQEREAHRERFGEVARAQLQQRHYAVLRGLIHPLQTGALRRYYRALVGRADLPLGDNQVSDRYRLHSEVVASFFHPQLTGMISRIAGEPVKPSYVYFASYQPGSALPRHTDREQCEFSLSLLVDYDPNPDGPCGWPLYIEDPTPPGVIGAANLGPGDAVYYRGRELPHFRDPLPAGHQSTSLFLHYVREDFAGDLW
jgi:hypothetical protein